ncbi:ATP-binding cassette domain-containing protein [Acuticoccus sp. M5D2P5]|uniref:ABC-F family ATP-binding cassette domain-containing protein n=1 Tax=Acuticoccus kalidii TaxID=2910977 RepID=UPI001F3627E4|nr:ABC-F family ATP-binding cassette domain-containing protein [Acuticoccus kalidii]MCF3931853.1 ATP-binding cassette domain-containing protein [Acuticoccus kalidii]
MPRSVTLSALTWTAPDGAAVLSDLDLAFGNERTGLVGRNGTGKTTLLRLIAGELSPGAGHVEVRGTLGILRQDMPTSRGETVSDLFGASDTLALIDRAEAGRATVAEIAAIDWTLPTRIEEALARCGLALDPRAPLAALSGGERTRAGLAALVFAEPDILLLDEPTNNLDADGRRAVSEILGGWRRAAIVVSHDRALLDEMDTIVELSGLSAARYGGNYSAYRAHKMREIDAAHRDLADAEKSRTAVRRRAQQAAERKARRDGRGRKDRAKGGHPKIIMDLAKERAEASAGAGARLRDTRSAMADEAVSAAREKVEIIDPLTMDMPTTGLSTTKTVLRLDAVSGGHDPRRPTIRDLSLTLTGPERVAVTGPNGSGKTTLLALITGRLAPFAGTVERRVSTAYLDQHVSILAPDQSLRDNFHRLNLDATQTEGRAALARFRFRADDALRLAGRLSGGERLRAGLACTIGRAEPPALLILDEPTNHLDLDAVEALEAALAGYDGALIVVSHDRHFLASLAPDREIDLAAAQGAP